MEVVAFEVSWRVFGCATWVPRPCRVSKHNGIPSALFFEEGFHVIPANEVITNHKAVI